MLRGDAPEKWQEHGRREPVEPPPPLSAGRRVATFVLFLAFIGAGVAAYVFVGRDTSLGATLPLPAKLRTASPAHERLLLFGRALDALAVDAQGRLPHPDSRDAATSNRLLARLAHLAPAGRELAPLVTREESRALDAFSHGERLLAGFLRSAQRHDGSFDPAVLAAARAQIHAGMEIAEGHVVESLVTKELQQLRESHRDLGGPGRVDVREVGGALTGALSDDGD